MFCTQTPQYHTILSTPIIISPLKTNTKLPLPTNLSSLFTLLLTPQKTFRHVNSPPNTNNKVGLTLDIFNQRYKTTNDHILNYQTLHETLLLNKITQRLTRAISDEQMRKKNGHRRRNRS